jgi:alanine racemase
VEVSQVGTITMDQMMFDVSALPSNDPALIGETITLIGEDDGKKITLSDWAKEANTIEYELMCQLRVRLPRTYTR